MKGWKSLGIGSALGLAAMLLALAQPAYAEKRVALVIGNKMPSCDMRDPSAIPNDAVPYLKLAPSTRSVSVELTYRDGSVSEIKTFRR